MGNSLHPMLRRLLVPSLAGIGAFAALAGSGVILNGTPSMPLGLYRVRHGFPQTRDSIVSFCPTGEAYQYIRRYEPAIAEHSTCPNGAVPFLKYAAALPGDRVSVRSDGVHVNDGPALAGSIPLELANGATGIRHLPRLSHSTWTIPPGHVWTYTPVWFSFDSRYYGPVAIDRVAVPLLVHIEPPHTAIPLSIQRLQKTARS